MLLLMRNGERNGWKQFKREAQAHGKFGGKSGTTVTLMKVREGTPSASGLV